MEEHKARVAIIVEQVRGFHERGERYRIYHGSSSTTRKIKLTRKSVVDTSSMNHVLKIDTNKGTALVEPNVSMEQLVDATLPHGLVPPVVMELPAITVGGGFAGTSGESSSFRHGLFDKTITSIEMVLANGEVVQASEHERADLLNAAAGSFGTFGVITMLEIRLLPAKPYVELTFSPIAGMDEAVRLIEEHTESKETDYLEGIMFSLHSGLIISGKFVNKTPSQNLPISRYTRAQDPWFYLRAQQVLYHSHLEEDYRELVPLKDYLFRYDRGTFWGGYYAFRYFLTPFNTFTRWLLDGFMRTEVMYRAMHKSHMADEYIVQDIGFPYATVGEFVEYLDQILGFYPLWLCPLKMDREMSLRPKSMTCFSAEARSQGMMLNVGLWGPGPNHYDAFVVVNRDIESKTAELGGLKCFYAQAFYTPREFWALYDKEWYDGMRKKYGADGLAPVNEKVNVDLSGRRHASCQGWREWVYERFKEQWPVRGVYGLMHVLLGENSLLTK